MDMNMSEDISQEEMNVFLEETDEQIKLLDEDLIVLEKSGGKPEIIQEIFRAAHTLKGSSAMLGFDKMSSVAHAMEAILDLVRNNKLEITSEIIDSLLNGLDMIKLFREKLITREDTSDVDVEKITAHLKSICNPEKKAEEDSEKNEMVISQESDQAIQNGRAAGKNGYAIAVELEQSSDWAAVRFFQVVSEISNLGEILQCIPSRSDIEAGKVGKTLSTILITSTDKETIEKAVNTVPEIKIIQLELVENSGEKSAAAQPQEPVVAACEENIVEEKTVKASQTTLKTTQASETIRVDVRLLDNLMNLVGEMVIDRNRIKQISKELELKYEADDTVSSLGETSAHMVSLVTDLQENILKARMLHIGTIMNGFPRMVRDLAQKANKKIDFIIEGQETELDRSIIEQIRDPLLHLLRNCVDHGIEMPEKRIAAGKSETGTIKLKAYHEQSHIVILVSDDGGGIDAEKVKNKAISRGILSEEDASRMSKQEVHNLIFAPGLSTAEKVTEVSGRGVGMDVVKTNVTSIGGSIFIDSEKGKGSNFTIRLPLTLATIDGILVNSGGLIYVIPISAIVEILRMESTQLQSVMGKEVFKLRDTVIPIVRLNESFGLNEGTIEQTSEEISIVVIKVGDKYTGLVVDNVLEPQESVVKSLGKYIGSVHGISGATIMGDGQVALIIDTATIVKTDQ